MPESPAFTPSPARVHDRARGLIGHHPCWIRQPHRAGLFAVSHFRICSYCRCIHPADLIELLDAGESQLTRASKDGKFLFLTPNPIAGDLVHMGSIPGAVFERHRQPISLRNRLHNRSRDGLLFEPTVGERLAGHFERPALEQAPRMIVWPFYAEHTTNRLMAEIHAAASQGETEHALSGT